MRIAMIGQKGIPAIYGGIERHVEELALELTKRGHSVLVYAREWYTPTNIKNYKGIKVVHTPCLRTKHLDTITHTFSATISALMSKVDVIHYHGVGPSLLSWIPRLFAPRVKVIANVHSLDRYHQKWGWFAKFMLRLGERAAFSFPHQTIVVSKTMRNYFLSEYQKQTAYIPNGVRAFDGPAKSSIIEDKWNLTPGKYLLMVSRLVRHKGAHYLIDAWQIARQQNPLLKDYKLVIVGGATNTNAYAKELTVMARGDSSIIFTGWQNGQALEELFTNAALFVHPSENEGLSIAMLQAMSAGRAVLTSDISENQEVILDEKFWFANANILSLAAKINELVGDQNALDAAGARNRKVSQERYGWNDITEKTLRLYSGAKTEPARELQTAII